jgi:cell division transport system permease protein
MLKHSVLEGLRNLVRSFWLSITAIFIIFVSLTSVAFVSSLWVVLGYTLRQFDNQAIIYIDLKENTLTEARIQMEEELKNLPEVKEVLYIDSEKALQEYQKNPISGRSYEALKNAENTAKQKNPNSKILSESYKITPKSSETYAVVEKALRQEKYKPIISNIQGTQEYIDALQRVYYLSGIGGTIIVVILSLISILVIINILRIAIYSRREEIEIMRLVGATNSYIRGPFIAEGIMYNFISSIFVFLLFIPLFSYITPMFNEIFGFDFSSSITGISSTLYLSLTLTNIVGLVIGGFSAMLATQRYLKL